MNKDQLEKKLQDLPFFKGNIDLKFFDGLMTNDSYLAYNDNNKYVVKVGGDKKHFGVIRSNEIEASKAGYKAGISPEIIYYDERILIFQYIHSHTLTPAEMREKKVLKKIISLIKFVQNKVKNYLKLPHTSNDIFQLLNNQVFHLKEKNSPYMDKINKFIKHIAIFEKKTQSFELVFAHNDYYHKNILDDGKKLWLVDWEFSGFNSPLLDLANVSKNSELSEDEDHYILEEFYGNLLTSSLKYNFQVMKCSTRLNSALWSMVAEIFAEKVFDYVSYTDTMLEKYEKQFDYFNNLKM